MTIPSNYISTVLKREFEDRSQRNPNYSMRAFAKSLGLSHTLLSLVVNGKRAPSKIFLKKVTASLWDSRSVQDLVHQIQKSKQENVSFADTNQPNEMTLEEFSRIATWIHYGILGLLSLPSFSLSKKSVSERLGISEVRAANAIDDLKACGYIKQVGRKWVQSVPPIRVDSSRSSPDVKEYTRNLLSKASSSMDEVSFEDRSLTNITFPMSRRDMPLAKERIKAFRRALCAELEANPECDDVYALLVQLIPLTRPTSKGESTIAHESKIN